MKPDAVVKSVEGYGLKAILQKPFIERISEDQYAELDTGNQEEPLFSPQAMQKLVQQTHGELIEELEYASEDEETGMDTLAQALLDKIEDLDDKDGDTE